MSLEEGIKKKGNCIVMCSNCCAIQKEEGWLNVRDNPDRWNDLADKYSSNLKISHGICPTCKDELYSDLY